MEMHKKLLSLFLIFVSSYIFAAPVGNSLCNIKVLYTGNNENEADKNFDYYKQWCLRNGWYEASSDVFSMSQFVQAINVVYRLRKCDSLDVDETYTNTTDKYMVGCVDFNKGAMFLFWLTMDGKYYYNTYFLPNRN
jgi:hypothetical protein